MKTMEMLNSALILLVIILVILLVVQWVVIVNQKKEIDKLVDFSNRANKELDKYRMREEAPIPFVPNIDYLFLEEEVKRLIPPYKVGQKVMYNVGGFVQVGYIRSIRTEQYEIMHDGTYKREVVVKHSYEIENDFYTDIIDVVKEDKE